MSDGRGNQKGAGMPSWVKGFVIAGAIAVVLVSVLLATGHGPWQHMGMGMHG
jgi:hypothetical protein